MSYPVMNEVFELVLKGATDTEIALSFTPKTDSLVYKRAIQQAQKTRKATEFFKKNPSAIEKGKHYCIYQIVRICKVNTTTAGNLFKSLNEAEFFTKVSEADYGN